MGYKVNYQGLDNFGYGIFGQVNQWQEELQDLSQKTIALINSTNMAGKGAESIREYMMVVHVLLQEMLQQLIVLHDLNYLRYKADYIENIDREYHVEIHQDELYDIKADLKTRIDEALDIQSDVDMMLRCVSSFFKASNKGVDDCVEAHEDAVNILTKLDNRIQELEARHLAADFGDTGDCINSLRSYMFSLFGKGRAYKTEFSAQAHANTEAFQKAARSYIGIGEKLEKESDTVKRAVALEEDRMSVVGEDYKARESKAVWVTIIAGAAITVVSIASTGGTATPAVIAKVSAICGGGSSAVSYMGKLYAADGTLKYISGREMSAEIAQGVLSGYVAGGVSAVSGNVVAKDLETTILPESVSKGISNAVGNAAGRIVETGMETNDIGAALVEGLDPNAILVDAVLGTATDFVGNKIPGSEAVKDAAGDTLGKIADGALKVGESAQDVAGYTPGHGNAPE